MLRCIIHNVCLLKNLDAHYNRDLDSKFLTLRVLCKSINLLLDKSRARIRLEAQPLETSRSTYKTACLYHMSRPLCWREHDNLSTALGPLNHDGQQRAGKDKFKKDHAKYLKDLHYCLPLLL